MLTPEVPPEGSGKEGKQPDSFSRRGSMRTKVVHRVVHLGLDKVIFGIAEVAGLVLLDTLRRGVNLPRKKSKNRDIL